MSDSSIWWNGLEKLTQLQWFVLSDHYITPESHHSYRWMLCGLLNNNDSRLCCIVSLLHSQLTEGILRMAKQYKCQNKDVFAVSLCLGERWIWLWLWCYSNFLRYLIRSVNLHAQSGKLYMFSEHVQDNLQRITVWMMSCGIVGDEMKQYVNEVFVCMLISLNSSNLKGTLRISV